MRRGASLVLVLLLGGCGGGDALFRVVEATTSVTTAKPIPDVPATASAATDGSAPSSSVASAPTIPDAPVSSTETSSVDASSDSTAVTSVATTTATTLGAPLVANRPDLSVVPGPDLAAIQVLARLDASRAVGTFDATVCNLGDAVSGEYRVTIAANGVEVVVFGQALAARECVDVFDPTVTFADFGVAEGDRATVTVLVEADSDQRDGNNLTQHPMVVAPTTPNGDDPDAWRRYRVCMDAGNPLCSTDLPRSAIPDAGEVMKMRDDFIAIVPAAYESIAAMAVWDLDVCLARLQADLGIPLVGVPVSWRFEIDPRIDHFGVGGGMITTAADDLTIRQWANGGFGVFNWGTMLSGRCAEGHEKVHVLVTDTPLPQWIEEGLATHAGHRGLTYWAGHVTYRCDDTGYVVANPHTGWDDTLPYARLELGPDREGRPPGDYYTTGACFWQWFEESYGHDSFRQVMRAFADLRRADYYIPFEDRCPPFLDVVESVIGESIAPITEQRFGFGPEYDCYAGP